MNPKTARGFARVSRPFTVNSLSPDSFSRRIETKRLDLGSHGSLYFHHRRRGFLAWQRFGFGGAWRLAAGARLYCAVAQARSLSQRRPRDHEPDPTWRGV